LRKLIQLFVVYKDTYVVLKVYKRLHDNLTKNICVTWNYVIYKIGPM